jgi:signal transduction histidine kinase
MANILVVDDDPGNILAVCAILEPLGQRLVTARSGDEALRHLLLEDFALVLIDVNMPGMSGLQTAQAMKSRERTKHVPIIFLTGVSTERGQVFSGYAHGAVDYLLKPFEPGVLRSKVSVFVELFLRGEQVNQLNAELERRVAERTRELALANAELSASLAQLRRTQEQLVHTGKMAAVGTLVAGLSHELNNPLSIIVSGTQSALRRLPAESNARPMLESVQQAAERCGRLVRSLLDFARRGPSGEREPIGAVHLAERVAAVVAGEARERGVKLNVDTGGADHEVGVVHACLAEAESALLNLLTNALDATTPDGAVQLRVRGAERNGEYGVEFSVTDTGPGIPSNVLPHIFEPFFTTKAAGRGTGLGLSLARQVVEEHGGSLRVESRPGSGATFRMWLPVKPQDRRNAEPSRSASSVSATIAKITPSEGVQRAR